ncbi:MAG: hypothetical protein IJ094_09200 [Bacilli bacterium]|nr:hypothetical protein [Bacilli bacterium]
MEVKVLGSVSPYPKDSKNGVGYLVESNSTDPLSEKILLDVGPASSRLLNMSRDLNNLTIIISHLHKDHYSDLSAIAYASYVYHKLGYLNKRIKVYIPNGDKITTKEYINDEEGWPYEVHVEKNIPDYEYLMNYGSEHYLEFVEYDNLDLYIGDIKVTSSPNPHNVNTYSIKLKQDDKTLVYSSDTGYKNNTLTSFSKNADLLICESTFLKGQIKAEDYHLYAYEAGLIAKEAGVKELMLTHFWPEIEKEKYVDEARFEFLDVFQAEEGVTYKIGDKHAAKLY